MWLLLGGCLVVRPHFKPFSQKQLVISSMEVLTPRGGMVPEELEQLSFIVFVIPNLLDTILLRANAAVRC